MFRRFDLNGSTGQRCIFEVFFRLREECSKIGSENTTVPGARFKHHCSRIVSTLNKLPHAGRIELSLTGNKLIDAVTGYKFSYEN